MNFFKRRFLCVATLALVLALLLVSSSLADSLNVHSSNLHAVQGLSVDIYFANSATAASPITVDTDKSVHGHSGFFVLPKGESASFKSPQFSAATEVPQGKLVLDLWAEPVVHGSGASLSVSACTTDSEGTVVNVLCSGEVTDPLPQDSGQLTSNFDIEAGTVPALGYLEVKLTAPQNSAVKVYWGSQQPSNFQIYFTYS
jgi:hypothetical protein